MRFSEDMLTFHPQSAKRIHIKEAAIAKFLVCCSPVRQSVVLLIQHAVQGFNVAVQLCNRLIDSPCNQRVLLPYSLQQPAQYSLVAMPREDHGALN